MIKQVNRVLIYRLGSLGDTIVALPCLHLISRAFPQAERFMLTTAPVNNKAPAISAVLDGSGLVAGYINYSYSVSGLGCLGELRRKITAWHPDLLIYLPGERKLIRALRDALFFKSCGIKQIIGLPYSRDLRKHRLLVDKLHFEYEALRLARCLGVLGDAHLEDPRSWDLLLSPLELKAAGEILEGRDGRENFIHSPLENPAFKGRDESVSVSTSDKPRTLVRGSRRLIACSIGTKFEVNDWGDSNWKALLELLSAKFSKYGLIFLGSLDEFQRSEELRKSWRGNSLNLCGKLNPRVSAALLSDARLFLGHDSGPMHLAQAAGITCVAIFSARNKPGIWFPYGPAHRVIYHKTECFGCGLAVCKKYKKKCINSITVKEVRDEVCRALAQDAG